MSIVRMSGGLGNQVFQYIFARYLEETINARVLIDDMHYFLLEDEINYNKLNAPPVDHAEKQTHNGYEIEYVFPDITKPVLLSGYFDEDIWQYMKSEIKKSPFQRLGVPRQLCENGLELSVLIESGSSDELTGLRCPVYKTPANLYNSAVTSIPGDVYYHGDWINPGWFGKYRDKFLKEFSFRPIGDDKNKQYENEIKNSFAIGIHVRRGDFVRYNWALKESYFYDTLTHLSTQYPDSKYFVFSDDPLWCKANKAEIGLSDKNTIFIEGNYDYKNNYIDMQLMSMCNVLVEGNSCFSHLASFLNQTPGFTAIKVRNPPADDLAGEIQRIM